MADSTGYKAYHNLEEYNVDTGYATGNTKPNVEGDPDYVAPVYDTNACPLPGQDNPPTIGTLQVVAADTDTDSIKVSWTAASDNGGIDAYRLYCGVQGGGAYYSFTVSGNVYSFTFESLQDNTTYAIYMRARDTAGQWSNNSNTVTATTDQIITYPAFDISAGYSTASGAEGQSTPYTRYHDGSGTYPSDLDKVYTDMYGNNVYDGQNLWFSFGNYVGKISNTGIVQQVHNPNDFVTITPSSRSVGASASSFSISVNSNTTWTVSTPSWVTISGASGSGDDTFTVSVLGNDNSTSRSGTITVTSSDNYHSDSCSITQEGASAYYSHSVGYVSPFQSGTNACNEWSNNNRITVWTDTQHLRDANTIYSNSTGTATASDGWYSNGIEYVRYLNGTVSNLGECNPF